jgi:hypothetical protein
MAHWKSRLLVISVITALVVVSGRWTLTAQVAQKTEVIAPGQKKPLGPALVGTSSNQLPSVAPAPASSRFSVQDALLKPFRFPFKQPTSLDEVTAHLRLALGAPVVLDLAALNRQELKPQDTVQLELDGVRLQTGLKLLLDQVGLTYRVVAEDNLLILTDSQGADDPAVRSLAELKTLHKEMHELQDRVEDLYQAITPEHTGPGMKNPTIIEEVPDAKAKPGAAPSRSRSG